MERKNRRKQKIQKRGNMEKNVASVKVLETSGRWIGITYKEDIEPAQEKFREMIENEVYPQNLWK